MMRQNHGAALALEIENFLGDGLNGGHSCVATTSVSSRCIRQTPDSRSQIRQGGAVPLDRSRPPGRLGRDEGAKCVRHKMPHMAHPTYRKYAPMASLSLRNSATSDWSIIASRPGSCNTEASAASQSDPEKSASESPCARIDNPAELAY